MSAYIFGELAENEVSIEGRPEEEVSNNEDKDGIWWIEQKGDKMIFNYIRYLIIKWAKGHNLTRITSSIIWLWNYKQSSEPCKNKLAHAPNTTRHKSKHSTEPSKIKINKYKA